MKHLKLRHEQMSHAFNKWHIDGLNGFVPSINVFTDIDTGYPHDHPFSFTTHILNGSYVEEVWQYSRYQNAWFPTQHIRHEGTSHYIRHNHIHRIIALPQGECTTIITPGEWIKPSNFYKFEEGKAWVKKWDETDDKFKLIENGKY